MRPIRRDGCSLGIIALIVLLPGGCGGAGGDGLPREPISGTVNFDGQPLKKGMIQFQPASQAEGMAAGGMIVDGRFEVAREAGPVPGKYKVQIESLDDTKPPLEEGELPGAIKAPSKKTMPKRLIPPRYNSQTALAAEVKPGVSNTYRFDLEK